MMVLTDELLCAYVDGELDAADISRVEHLLADNAEARQTVNALRETAALLAEAYRLPASHPEPAPMAEAAASIVRLPAARSPEARRWRRWAGPGAALAASLALAAVLGPWWDRGGNEAREHMLEEVAAYHTLYARETEHLAEVPASRLAHLEEWLGDRLERRLSVPDLSASGWTFEGGRMLAAGTVPIAQLLYTAPGREPIAVCIMKSGETDGPPEIMESHGLRVAAWDRAGYLYVVVGALDESEVREIANTVMSVS